MFFDHTGTGGCYRGISVDPRFRQNVRPNGSCTDNRPPRPPRPDNDCGNERPFPPRPDNGCDDERPFPPRPEPDCDNDGDCCTDGIRAVLAIATRTLGRNDTIDVEITLSSGYTQTVTLGRGGAAIISSDILRTPQGAVSICDITRLQLLSASVSDPEYMQRLQNELQRFIGRNMRRPAPDCFEGNCDDCVEAMQRYIMRNANNIDSLLFDGSESVSASVVTGTVTEDVLTSAELVTTLGSFVTSAEITTDTVEAVTAVTAAETEVVTAIELLPTSLVSAVATETAEVSGPVTVTETEVTAAVTLTDTAEFASGLTVTPGTVVGAVTTETTDVVSGFAAPETVTGVLSGIESAAIVNAAAVTVPVLSSDSTGVLQIVIPANAFGTDIPATEVTLSVTAGGSAVTYGGTETVYALSAASALLGAVIGTPAVSDITVPGAAETTAVISSVTATDAEAVTAVEFTAVSGALATDVTTAVIGSAAAPEAVEVISAVTAEFATVNGTGDITAVPASELISTDTAAVISGVELAAESVQALTSATITTDTAAVISGITTTPVTVSSPSYFEPVNGDIIGARRGIIAVDNADGDISVYSSCAVKGAQLEDNGTT